MLSPENTPRRLHVEQAIAAAIREATEKIATEEIALANKRVEERVRGEVAKISARVATHMSFERVGQDLVVTVRFPPTA